jgi:hypothetical protein
MHERRRRKRSDAARERALGLIPMAVSFAFQSSARYDLVNAVNVDNDALGGPIAPNAFAAPSPPSGGR